MSEHRPANHLENVDKLVQSVVDSMDKDDLIKAVKNTLVVVYLENEEVFSEDWKTQFE